MDAIEAIETRRSVRRYENKQIDDEIVERLLSAAMNAPSAANEQPWEFIVIKDREMLDAIPTFSPFARAVTHAPLGILDLRRYAERYRPWILGARLRRGHTEPSHRCSRAWIGGSVDRECTRWTDRWPGLPSTASSPKALCRLHSW